MRYTHKPLGKSTYDTVNYYQFPVGVYRHETDLEGDPGVLVGQFTRNFSDIGPFFPFRQGGRDYALYSPNYTLTRVMSLPDCKDIAGEVDDTEAPGCGYCPIEFYVPKTPEQSWVKPYVDHVDGHFGFVSGCFWGMESYNPIFYLDLSKISEGKFVRDNRLGFPQQPRMVRLEKAVDVWGYTKDRPFIGVANEFQCDLRESYDWNSATEAENLLREIHKARGIVSPESMDDAVLKVLAAAIHKYTRF